MKKLSLNQMEQIEGGMSEATANSWLEVGCIAGGIAMGFFSGPAFALTASLTIHACLGYVLTR